MPTLSSMMIQACFKPQSLIKVSQYKHLPVLFSKNNKPKEGKSLIKFNKITQYENGNYRGKRKCKVKGNF